MDILPRNASPILKRNTNPKIPIAILKPFFLKKLTTGPPTVSEIQAITFAWKPIEPILS